MTGPISRDDLNALIRHHRDNLTSLRWELSSAGAHQITQTIKALSHYLDLLDTIDCRPPDPDPTQDETQLQPLLTSRTEEKL